MEVLSKVGKEDIKRRNVNTKKSIQSQKHRIDFDNEVVIKHSLTKKKSKSKKKRKKTPIKVSIEEKIIKKKKSNVVNKTVIQTNKPKTMILNNNNQLLAIYKDYNDGYVKPYKMFC